jgi:hypothetical protein
MVHPSECICTGMAAKCMNDGMSYVYFWTREDFKCGGKDNKTPFISFIPEQHLKWSNTTGPLHKKVWNIITFFERNVVGEILTHFFNNKNPNLHPWGLRHAWLDCTSTILFSK